MSQDIDAFYPYLSALAQSQGRTLSQLGQQSKAEHDNPLKLGDCCWAAMNKRPRWGSNCDSYNYLATLNEHARNLDSPKCKTKWLKLWKDITQGQARFLNTVVEAAWAVYFKDMGYDYELEVRFDTQDPESKDADFLVTVKGKRWWLDVYSLNRPPRVPGGQQSVQQVSAESVASQFETKTFVSLGRRNSEAILAELVEAVHWKYKDKFKKVVRSGLLNGSSVGVLMCILQRASSIIPSLVCEERNAIQAPAHLFGDKYRNLDLVWIHLLAPSRNDSDVLAPSTVLKWSTQNVASE